MAEKDDLDKPVQQWCDKHWAVFREGAEKHELSGIMASMLVMEKIMEDDTFKRRCGWNPEKGTLADGSPHVMNAAMAELSPICCHLGDAVLSDIYRRCKKEWKEFKEKVKRKEEEGK